MHAAPQIVLPNIGRGAKTEKPLREQKEIEVRVETLPFLLFKVFQVLGKPLTPREFSQVCYDGPRTDIPSNRYPLWSWFGRPAGKEHFDCSEKLFDIFQKMFEISKFQGLGNPNKCTRMNLR